MRRKYSEKQLKEVITHADNMVSMEISFIPNKEGREIAQLVKDGFIDHLYTLLGFGDYEPYLDRAKVIRAGDEDGEN